MTETTYHDYGNGYRLAIRPDDGFLAYDEIVSGAGIVYLTSRGVWQFNAYDNLPPFQFDAGKEFDTIETYARYLKIFHGFNIHEFDFASYGQGEWKFKGFAYSRSVAWDSQEGKDTLELIRLWLIGDVYAVTVEKETVFYNGDRQTSVWEAMEETTSYELLEFGRVTPEIAELLAPEQPAETPRVSGVGMALAVVGDELTEINAHTARTLMDWALGVETGYKQETLEAAYEAARKVLAGIA